jgi:hypothetical protein
MGGCRIMLMSGSFNYTNLPPVQQHLPFTGGQAHPVSSAPYTAVGHYWGPSSDHAGKLIGNVFGDGHVEFISADVDPNTYHVLSTRGNGEPVPRIVCAGHRHVVGHIATGDGLCVVTSAWQALTTHGQKVVSASRSKPSVYVLDWRGIVTGELPRVHRRIYEQPHPKAVSA